MVVFGLYLGESAALDASAISLRVAAIRLPHFPTRTFLNFNRPAPPSPFPLYTGGINAEKNDPTDRGDRCPN